MSEKKEMAPERKGAYLEMPTPINARQVLETVSFIRAAYIRRALNDLDSGKYERVEERLEQAMTRMQGFIDEIKDVIEYQGGRSQHDRG